MQHKSSISAIIEQKEKIEEELVGSEAMKKNLKALSEKNKKMRKLIADAFDGLQSVLDKKKKEAMRELDNISKKVENRAK